MVCKVKSPLLDRADDSIKGPTSVADNQLLGKYRCNKITVVSKYLVRRHMYKVVIQSVPRHVMVISRIIDN